MKPAYWLLFTAAVFSVAVSCNAEPHVLKPERTLSKEKAKDTLRVLDSVRLATQQALPLGGWATVLMQDMKPVFGYRFVIAGDFDGDGNQEDLVEHYYSGLFKTEVPKFYENMMYWDQIDVTMKRDPYSYALSSNKNIDTLRINSTGQLFGISYMKNEGDLNGDGTDEVSYVIDYADFSNLNSWHIVTCKNGKWQELYSFGIWDWQLPPLPQSGNQYYLFGTYTKVVIPEQDTLNLRLEQQLKAFKGLVRKTGPGRIDVTHRNDEAEEDTLSVVLSRF